MPIPSLSSSLKPKSQSTKTNDLLKRESRLKRTDTSQETQASSRLPQPSTAQITTGPANRRTFVPKRGEAAVKESNGASRDGSAPYDDTERRARRQNDSIPEPVEEHVPPVAPRTRQSRLRPQSMHIPSVARSGAHDDPMIATASQPLRRATGAERQPGTGSGLSRTFSLRKPAVPTQPAGAPKATTHSRTSSISAVASTQREPTKGYTARTQRPKSLIIERPETKTPGDTGATGTRTSQRIATLKPSLSVKTKPERPGSSDSRTSADTDPPHFGETGKHPEASKEVKRPPRPAFSTYQQHFTPRKTSKAPTSAFLHPAPPDPASYALPSEIVALQTELLQLSLFHGNAAQIYVEWQRSVKKYLHKRFDEVTSMYAVLRDNERQELEQANMKALREWSSGDSSVGVVEHIQLLSGPMHELPSLMDPAGRFSKLVDEFTHWIAWVEEVWHSRDDSISNRGSAEGLGDSWKADNAAITRKLTAFSRDLDRLREPAAGSSIASIVVICKMLVGGMLEELRTMQAIEEGVVVREREWVEAQLTGITQDIGSYFGSNDGNEMWRQ